MFPQTNLLAFNIPDIRKMPPPLAMPGNTPAPVAKVADRKAEPKPRQIYVLHSGMRDPGNFAAESIKAGLIKRGVPEKDIILMPAIYPDMTVSTGAGVKDNLRIFKDSSDPKSKVSDTAFEALQARLKEAGVTPQDKLHWVGHSAGGQMGLTMAGRLEEYRQKNKDNPKIPGLSFDSVTTFGSPIATNTAPAAVRIRHYTSPDDLIQNGSIGGMVGKPVPENLDANDRVVSFNKIGHLDWYKDTDPAVFDRLLRDTRGEQIPAWAYYSMSLSSGNQFRGGLEAALEQATLRTSEDNKGVKVPDNATNLTFRGRTVSVLGELSSASDYLGSFVPKRKEPSPK
ncbi:MAG: alpha/beta hydrolase [Cyanobacteria bacterium]|nr:alpha/beta hydrolase [Cyanobacteriota bacterium]